ncbi:MAG: hypothetical protein WCD70_10390 [Alphaproteobacteria bacterium]
MSTALVPIENLKGVEIFKPGAVDPILERIEREAREEAAKLDISTETSRKAIASLAYKVARSKTYLDEEGKKLTEDQKKIIDTVNAERRRVRERLDLLKDEVRKPLTDWEQIEEDRTMAHKAALDEIEKAQFYTESNWQTLSSEVIADRIKEIESDSRDWEEFSVRAAGVKAVALDSMRKSLASAQKVETERAELERLRAEAAERAIKEREEAAARAATEAAERNAKEQAEAAQRAAEAEQQRIENERLQAEARAKQAEEKAKRDAEEAEKRLIAEKQAAARRAEEAAAQAKRDQERAIESERQRVADEARRIKEADDARERNQSHRRKVNREALDGLSTVGIPEALGKALIEAIIKGNIPHVTITY